MYKRQYELFEDLAKQNVIYAEVRFAPSLHTQEGLSYERVVESAIKGMNRAKKEFKIEGNLLLCCMRGEDNTLSNLTTVATAKKYLNHGVCGLDLAGAEALFPTSEFADIFKVAKEQNIDLDLYDVVRVKASTGRAAGDYDYVLMPKQNIPQAPIAAPATPQVADSINFDVNTGL